MNRYTIYTDAGQCFTLKGNKIEITNVISIFMDSGIIAVFPVGVIIINEEYLEN